MLYTLSELGDELGVPPHTLREWMTKGMPCQRDERDHIWVNGKEFAAWVNIVRRLKAGPKLQADEAYCFRCHKPVKLLARRTQIEGKHVLLRGTCPTCGCNINRGGRNGES